MRFNTLLLILLFACSNSSENSSKWVTATDDDSYIADVLPLSEMKVNNVNAIISKSELVELLGKPDTIIEGGGFISEANRSNDSTNKVMTHYEHYHYDNLKFAVWDDNAQLSFIDFRNKATNLTTGELKLNRKTTLDKLMKLYPGTFEWRNYPLHRQFGFDPSLHDLEKEKCTWLDFKNGLDPFYWNIELTFYEDKLIWADFQIVEEKYRP